MKNIILSISIMLLTICGCQNGFSIDPTTNKIILPPAIENTLARLDTMAESMPVVLENTQEILDTPAGKLIPEPVKNVVGVGLLGISSIAAWYLNMRKNLFKTGFDELAMANELAYANGGDKKILMDAESKALNPRTLKLMKSEGYKRRIIDG